MDNISMNITVLLVVLLCCACGAFLISRLCKDNSVMDILYGPIVFTGAAGLLIYVGTFTLLPLLLTGCVGIWATRLGVRIFRKNIGKPEDARYAAWRQKWLQRGKGYFLVRSFLQINLLQIGVIFILLLPVLIATAQPTIYSLPWIIAGMIVFVFGLSYETIADWQLDQFIADKKPEETSDILMTKGLFRFSRRPNYFGESMVWWGLAIMTLPLPFGWIGLLSPILITYIVTRVTGPILEKQFFTQYPQEYAAYMKTTNYFVPGARKR